jgi:Omp85 superfamily domain
MSGQDQSRMGVQLTFRKGRPFVTAADAVLSLSSTFCSGSKCARDASGSLAASGAGVEEMLLKRLNLTLADIPYPDLIACTPLFKVIDRDRPEEPDEDEPEDEKAQYRRDLEEFKRKAVEPPDPPADDATEDEKKAYETASKVFGERTKAIGKLVAALHEKMAALPSTRALREYGGGWADFFKDAPAAAEDGPFEKWRAEVSKSEEVRAAFRRLWQAVDGEEHEFVIEARGETLRRFYTGQPLYAVVRGEDETEKSLLSGLVKSPLVFLTQGSEAGVSSPDLGQLCFQFSDPIRLGGKAGPNFTITPKDAAAVVVGAMRRYGLEGVPWSQEAVLPALNSYYAERGYDIKLLVSEVREAPVPRSVQVLRRRVSLIRLSKMSDEEALRVLQTLLPASAFEELVRNDKGPGASKYLTRVQTGSEEGDEQILLRLRRESEPAGEDPKLLAAADDFLFFDAFKHDRIAAALKEIHYGLTDPQPGSDETDTGTVPLTLTVFKLGDEESGGSGASPTHAPPAATTPTSTASPSPSPSPTATPNQTATPPTSPTPATEKKSGAFDEFLSATLFKVCPRGNNLFYGGVLLRPRQGARAVGGYKCLKAGPGAVGLSAGEDGGGIGSLSYSAVVPFFGTGPFGARRRPLAVAFEASTTFERSRLINGEHLDERRKGGMLRLVLPLRAPAERLQFDIAAEARHQTVSLIQGDAVVAKQNLTTLDFGARLYRDARTAALPHYWELTPRLKLGLGLAEGEPAFALFSATAAAHGALGYAFDYDLKGRVSAATAGTPIFERPTFGAPDTVRGFQSDDAIGLRTWSAQPELWLRGRGLLAPGVNPLTGEEGRLRGMFRESLSFAVFYDVGGVYKTVNSPAGVRGGPGAGLRFNYRQRAYIKLDWAYGLGDRAGGRRRLRFYFTLDLPENPL